MMNEKMTKVFDVAVIGGGVVGCAVLHQLTMEGYDCILFEKEKNLIIGASSGNSGIYASGFDTTPQSLEGKCLSNSAALNERIFRKYNLPRGKPGAIITAMNEVQMKKLPELIEGARESGVTGCKLLNKSEICQLEPNISPEVAGGVWVPGERAFDPWLLPITLAHVSKLCGAQVKRNTEIRNVSRRADGTWTLEADQLVVNVKTVINAAGLYGDHVEALQGHTPFKIKPRLGEYIVYDKKAGHLVNHVLMPVPTELGRGILIFRSVHGNLVVGPTARDVNQREVDQVSDSSVEALKCQAERMIPHLASYKIMATYAGLRPATQYSDYQIHHHPHRNWVTVGGIRSTGASACLSIASYVHYLVRHGLQEKPSRLPVTRCSTPAWRVLQRGTLLMDNDVYQITHPITKYGLDPGSTSSKL